MVGTSSPHDDEKLLVRRGRVGSVDLYEVKEHELELLEKGSTATLQFNFAIFLFSTAITCIVALVTSNFKWQTVRVIFILVSIVGITQGTYLIISWWRAKTSIRKLIATIRNRIEDQSSNVQIPEESETQPKKPENDEEPYG